MTQFSSFSPNSTANGTLTSVGLSLPTDIFDSTNNPLTSDGAISVTLKTQVKNLILSGPETGADAAPTFRLLVSDDIPALAAAKISDFQTEVSANTDVTNAVAAIHDPVTLGTNQNGLGLSTQVLTLDLADTSNNGALSSTDWNTFNGKADAAALSAEVAARKARGGFARVTVVGGITGGTPLVLTAASPRLLNITATGTVETDTAIVQLPDATTLTVGDTFRFYFNPSTSNDGKPSMWTATYLTVNFKDGSGADFTTFLPCECASVILTDNSTVAGTWDFGPDDLFDVISILQLKSDLEAYTAATPGDWSGTAPTTIAAAIDRLAALVKTLNGGTGA